MRIAYQKLEQSNTDAKKHREAIIENHREKMSPFCVRRLRNQRSSQARIANPRGSADRATNERSKLPSAINRMRIWMEGDRHRPTRTAFPSEAKRYNERGEDYQERIARLKEKLPTLDAKIDELNGQMYQLELQLLEP